MLHVINNSLATFDGFTGYSVWALVYKQTQAGQGRDTNVPNQSTTEGVLDRYSVGGDTGGRMPSWLSYCFLILPGSRKMFIRVGVMK